MRSDFERYSWRNHMPSLGPVDLAVAALTGLAMSFTLVCGTPGDAGTRHPADAVAGHRPGLQAAVGPTAERCHERSTRHPVRPAKEDA